MEAKKQALVARRRAVASCSNCYRRKQKCNHQKPCNNCLARKVSQECFYDQFPGSSSSQPAVESANPTKINPSINEAVRNKPAVHDQFGYSSITDSNAFVESDMLFRTGVDHNTHGPSSSSNQPEARKYWEIVSYLPPIALMDVLLSYYFAEIHWIYALVEPCFFNNDLKEWRSLTSRVSEIPSTSLIPLELKYFPAVLFQILATSCQHLPPGSEIEKSLMSNTRKLSSKYSDTGAQLIQILESQEKPMAAILHDLLRAAWLKNEGRGTQAWQALSDSVRKAQVLNLHQRGRTSLHLTTAEFWLVEWRKRMWILLYIWDSNMSIILGRPRLINPMDCDVEAPIDFDIPEDFKDLSPSVVKHQASRSNMGPSSLSITLFSYWLGRKLDEIRVAGADKRGVKDYSMVQRFHYEMLCLLDELPPTLHPLNPDRSLDFQNQILPLQRERIYSSIQCLLLALHRPHVAQYVESRQKAQEAALNILDSQHRLFELMNSNHYAYFGTAFFSINAVIVLSTMVSVYHCNDNALLHRIVLAIQLAVSRLCLMEPQNELAQAGIKIMRSCYQNVKHKHDESARASAVSLTGVPIWPPQTENRNAVGEARKDKTQYLDFASMQVDLDMDFLNMDSSYANHGELGLMNPVEIDEVGLSYWMGYRQIVFDDATHMLAPDSVGFSGTGP